MTQKTILITGCSSGIGYDAALGLRDAGWRVFASCRKAEDCERLKAEGFESPRIDYQDSESILSGLADVLEATGGTLDALYNNGAYATPAFLADLPRDALRQQFETNVFGWHELTRAILPVMRQQGHGRIVNCSSVLGLVGGQWKGAYVASKFAIEGLTDCLRLELRGSGIAVVLIEPGPITSAFRRNSAAIFEQEIDWRRSARADEYATLIARFASKDAPDTFELPASAVTKKLLHAVQSKRPKARYYVTTPTYLVGFLKRILPTRMLDAVLARG